MSSFSGLFGRNFRRFTLAIILVAVFFRFECTNAGGNAKNSNINIKLDSMQAYDLSAIQWACEPFLDGNHNGEVDNFMTEKTRELCMILRAGDLGEVTESDAIVFAEKSAEGATEYSNSSMEESSASRKTETDGTKTDYSSSGTDITNDEVEDEYVPSCAPTDSAIDSKSKYMFSVLQENDGHETDPDGIPDRYLKMQNNNRDAAKTALEKTIEWRKENEIDSILARPHPKFDVSKVVFPHYFCGRDDTQHVILLQRPGLMNIKLAHKNNLSGDELLFHYIYVMEYLWRIVDPASDATMTSIIDLTDMNISILRKREQLRIGSLFLSTMDAHFPQRSHRTFLINAPKWFGALYKLCSPLLRESTKEKIQILTKGKEQDEVLKNLLRDCPIPEGDKYENVPAGIMEEELRNFCLARLEEAGVTMQSVEYV